MAKDKDILSEAKEAYRLHLDAERDNRDRFIEDYRFARLGEQWPADITEQRQRNSQPCLTINKLSPFIRQIVNDARQNRPRIRVKPVDGFADPKTALALDGLVLNIENRSNAAAAYDTAVDNATSGGFGYWRIDVDYSDPQSFDKDLTISRIQNPLSVVGDAYSEAVDSSDWNTAFVTSLLTKDRFEELYKGAAESSWFDTDYRTLKDDWLAGDEILVAEYWTRDQVDKKLFLLSDGRTMLEEIYLKQADQLMMFGIMPTEERMTKGFKVTQHLLTGAEVLKKVDWAGQYIPIVPVYGEEIVIDGKRNFMSLINAAKDPQRRYNYWVSAATELVALSPKTPYIGEERAFSHEPAKWETVNKVSHPYIAIPTGSQPPQRQPLDGGQALGAISQALTAADDIKAVLGMYDASLGARSNETSGKAIMARQREGDTATFHFIDNLTRAIQHTGCILVDLIPHVYTPGRMVRILGQDGKAAVAKVENRMPGQPPPQMGPLEEGVPEGVTLAYDFGTGRYDVEVDAGPSYTTQREETVQVLTELMRAVPNSAPLVADKLFKAMNIGDAEEIAERFKAMLPPQAAGGLPPQLKEVMEGMKQNIEKLSKENEQLKSKTAIEADKIKVDAYTAETARLKELLPYMPPETLAALGLQMNVQAINTPDIAPGAAPQQETNYGPQ